MDPALGKDWKDMIIKSPKAVFQFILEEFFNLQLQVALGKAQA